MVTSARDWLGDLGISYQRRYPDNINSMSRLIPAAERIFRARDLIQQARSYPIPADGGRSDFSYIAHVKDFLRQARDLIKFIPLTPSATDKLKEEVKEIFADADRADQELLHRNTSIKS